jgi:hypothetical protein
MPSYDAAQFKPPAPVARVTLRNPATGVTVSDVVLLVDSGADVTLLPRRAIEQLQVAPVIGPGYEVAGFDGTKTFIQAVNVDMVFLRRLFKGQYLVIDEDPGILGRDVLNHVALLLDGPSLKWEEHKP